MRPAANDKVAEQLAVWIRRNHPDVFAALYKQVETKMALHGLTDVFASIGTGIANATQAVGSFLTSPAGVSSLGSLSALYLQTQQQKAALKIQTQLAANGMAPAPIQNVSDPYSTALTPYYYPPNGAPQLLTPQLSASLMPSMRFDWKMVAIPVGAGLLAIFLINLARR